MFSLLLKPTTKEENQSANTPPTPTEAHPKPPFSPAKVDADVTVKPVSPVSVVVLEESEVSAELEVSEVSEVSEDPEVSEVSWAVSSAVSPKEAVSSKPVSAKARVVISIQNFMIPPN